MHRFARFPAVDILVNNVGIFEPKSFDKITDDGWYRILVASSDQSPKLASFRCQRVSRQPKI